MVAGCKERMTRLQSDPVKIGPPLEEWDRCASWASERCHHRGHAVFPQPSDRNVPARRGIVDAGLVSDTARRAADQEVTRQACACEGVS